MFVSSPRMVQWYSLVIRNINVFGRHVHLFDQPQLFKIILIEDWKKKKMQTDQVFTLYHKRWRIGETTGP